MTASIKCNKNLYFAITVFLILLIGSGHSWTDTPGNVTRERALNVDANPGDWLLYGRDYGQQRYSPLGQINSGNVSELGLAWAVDVASSDGLLATPIVIDNVIYLSGSFSQVFAFDAKTGTQLWHYDPRVRRGASIFSSWGVRSNRGVAVWEGKVFVGTGDCRLIAINAATGNSVWETQVCDPEQNYGITGAPHVADGTVFMGNAGSEHGARGYVSAFDAHTGDEKWRFYTVPGDPAKGYENIQLEMAAKTWTGDAPWKFGGGVVWDAMTYDPEFNSLYIGTACGIPWDYSKRSPGGGDNLFMCSIVALDAENGEYKWHYQTVPRDAWDYDAAMHMILADLTIDGVQKKVLMQAPKNGFFYVLERETGELISANNYVKVTWASEIDLQTGRPVEIPGARYYENEDGKATVYPTAFGAHCWHAMSYSPATGLVYIPAIDFPTTFTVTDLPAFIGMELEVELYGYTREAPPPMGSGKLIAWDPLTQSPRWQIDYPYPFNGGVLSTSGSLVIQGTATGEVKIYSDDMGKLLWSAKTGSAIQAPPVSVLIDGEQHIIVAAGWSGASRTVTPEIGASMDARGPSRLFAFKLNASHPYPVNEPDIPFTKPPHKVSASDDEIRKGEALFNAHCSLCHGFYAAGGGYGSSIHDLRRINKSTYDRWFNIVLEGERNSLGMPSFGDYLGKQEARYLLEYVISRGWEEYGKENAGNQHRVE